MKLRGLYAITPESGDIADKVRQALEGGAALLQYRRKKASSLEEARALAALARRHGAAFIVNDDVELALAVDADGVHLGRDDGDVPAARRALKGKLLGVSCYNDPAAARDAVGRGADYIAFGSVYSSPTKPAAVRAPLSLFRQNPGVPVCAIGGITLANAAEVIAAGAAMVAVISDLFDAPDIRLRATQFKGLFS
jgi:thiamine-phosphate pyrophosphorylase